MANLIQIIYISRSTFQSTPSSAEIEPNVARILAKSRSNNRKRGLVGVLYFGDGCFFQCLEGEEHEVESLYQTLLADDRHKDLKLLSRKMINQLSYPDWSMKYVPVEDEMQRLLAFHGYTKFDPYSFDANMTQSVMNLLQVTMDPSESKVAEEEKVNPARARPASPSSASSGSMNLPLLISCLALILALVAVVLALSK